MMVAIYSIATSILLC